MENLSFDSFNNFNALYMASYRVCRTVRWKDSTIKFEQNRLETILNTKDKLNFDEYVQMVFSCFSIIERGKPRDIRACHIDDRLVQNALCENYLLPTLTPKLIYDNIATLKGRGIDQAIKRAKIHLQKAHREYGRTTPIYALRIDIRKYFDSIDHDYLIKVVHRHIEDEDVRDLLCYIISTFSYRVSKDTVPDPKKTYYVQYGKYEYRKINVQGGFSSHKIYFEKYPMSLGLGSQTSQLLALLTLNDLDHFCKERLRFKYYGRYMDDIYILHNDSKILADALIEIEKELGKANLTISPKKTVISKITPLKEHESHYKSQPFKYLKWNFYITENGKVLMLPFKEKLAKQRRKIRKLYGRYERGEIPLEDVISSYERWRANIIRGTTFHVVQEMDNYFHKYFKGVKLICMH